MSFPFFLMSFHFTFFSIYLLKFNSLREAGVAILPGNRKGTQG